MLTRAGRVVLMDFGIAKAVASGGTVAGTPAYWPPEQAVGAPADPRSDVFAAGIVLAEMVAPGGTREVEQRQALWQAVREDPPRIPETPWSEAIARAVAKDPGRRYPSAQALARALEEVAHRVSGVEEAQPYPGLASFTEADAEYFFGREAEVEGAWKRLPGRHLLAVVGPSGAGKSSFLRAGLVPAKPEGWAHLICTPGDAPFVALGQALVPEVSRDTNAMRQMLRFEDVDVAVDLFRRWRSDHREALVIVDQLEELFTLNPAEVQARFASLLSRLVLEADVHVLLSIRDDFLLRCQEHDALRPVFSDLMPLGAPTGDALRRALVQPALKCGYRFEDEGLVSEMLQAVEGERGALPLLAFAAASLWERRDREAGLLTRAAHEAIGGVAGALVQHAEATLERIGTAKLPLVRELFRNLVTAEGTRAVRDVGELLTVFPEGQRADAETVLKGLIDARLLTSYEAHAIEPGQTAGRRVEVVHESLLSAWPRLVRWRTEDEGSAQLRDQLRQVAHLWEEKGKPDDLLWTGTSYQEYQVWRSRYPGGLSESEETFARAMVARAERRRRQRRMAYAAGLAAVVLVASGLGILLRKSVQETGQREAAQLFALGRLRLAEHPNAALAYAIASLERSDNGPARRFAVEALWQGPPAFFIADSPGETDRWSPDGRWLALGGLASMDLLDGYTKERRHLSSSMALPLGFTSDSRRLVTRDAEEIEVWALPEARLERTIEARGGHWLANDSLLTLAFEAPPSAVKRPILVRRLSLDGTTEQVIGHWEGGPHTFTVTGRDIDPAGTWIVWIEGGRVLQQWLDALSAPPRLIGTHEGEAVGVWVGPWRDRVVTGDSGGGVRIWNVPTGRLERALKSPASASFIALDPRGRFLATSPFEAAPPRSLFLFDLAAPRTAEPIPLLDSDVTWLNDLTFSPDGSWLTSEHSSSAILWNMAGARSIVLGRQKPPNTRVAFTRDGHLLSASDEGVLRSWPLSPAAGERMRELWSEPDARIGAGQTLEVDPGDRSVVLADPTGERWQEGRILVVPLDGSPPSIHRLKHPEGRGAFGRSGSLDAGGRFLALAITEIGHPETTGIRVLDLATGDERTLDTRPGSGEGCEQAGGTVEGFAMPVWLRDGRLVSNGAAGLKVWDLVTGTSRLLRPCRKDQGIGGVMLASPDSRTILGLDAPFQTGSVSSLSAFDLVSRTTHEIRSHGNRVNSFALDARGAILVTGGQDGTVRVGPVTGEEPHLLFGHTGPVTGVAVSPDGRWIASGSDDGTIRLWPMPDLSKPPLHTLPHDQLVAKLRSLTNLRAARDPASDTGWKIEIGPFPGWAVVPKWEP
jgi:WD40 repeat protein